MSGTEQMGPKFQKRDISGQLRDLWLIGCNCLDFRGFSSAVKNCGGAFSADRVESSDGIAHMLNGGSHNLNQMRVECCSNAGISNFRQMRGKVSRFPKEVVGRLRLMWEAIRTARDRPARTSTGGKTGQRTGDDNVVFAQNGILVLDGAGDAADIRPRRDQQAGQ